ncbi:EF-hand calcium-binding domain-containing protein 9 [Tritrichomonas foetus]|uniref:EF-hand calcium-binding domain-containing protein 9 n=1 Tax=Tritrichomonas foetus TaxID=1144522 RepID=A0A1J4J5U2_9EUKA|nr:EF-hand calcium-binding domain-containing protein 9 [Tritrichomonas foetus]|eukprot:OHS94598.1 EF-hand calcium-binding domain-containing protein 9 [Tritrichomonas foetus]
MITRDNKISKEDYKITPLTYMHLTPPTYNLSARNFQIIQKLYQMLDYTNRGIDDVVFKYFIRAVFKEEKSSKLDFLFDLFDTNISDTIDFDEFYILIQILIAIRDKQIRQFFKANTRIVFDLIDSECLGMITQRQQRDLSFLINMNIEDVKEKFKTHDTSRNGALDYEEFKILVLDCLDNTDEQQRDQMDEEGEELSDSIDTTPESSCLLI